MGRAGARHQVHPPLRPRLIIQIYPDTESIRCSRYAARAPERGAPGKAGGNVDNKVFSPIARRARDLRGARRGAQDSDPVLGDPLVGAQDAGKCSYLFASHFPHVHLMSFRIKCLCAVKVTPKSPEKLNKC
jgi:hypothetical protein